MSIDREGVSPARPEPAGSADLDDAVVWEALGVLSAGYGWGWGDALGHIRLRAQQLAVDPSDVAHYVLWRGALPQ